jgi:hypothetical protein
VIWTPSRVAEAARAGVATPDGRLPIEDVDDVIAALLAAGRTPDLFGSATHIVRRGREMGLTASTIGRMAEHASIAPDVAGALGRVWDADAHPRGRDGRFIEVGAFAQVFDGAREVASGRVVGFSDGKVVLRSEAAGGTDATFDYDQVQTASVKAEIPSSSGPTSSEWPPLGDDGRPMTPYEIEDTIKSGRVGWTTEQVVVDPETGRTLEDAFNGLRAQGLNNLSAVYDEKKGKDRAPTLEELADRIGSGARKIARGESINTGEVIALWAVLRMSRADAEYYDEMDVTNRSDLPHDELMAQYRSSSAKLAARRGAVTMALTKRGTNPTPRKKAVIPPTPKPDPAPNVPEPGADRASAAAAVAEAEATWQASPKGDREKMKKRDTRNAAVQRYMAVTGMTDMSDARDAALKEARGGSEPVEAADPAELPPPVVEKPIGVGLTPPSQARQDSDGRWSVPIEGVDGSNGEAVWVRPDTGAVAQYASTFDVYVGDRQTRAVVHTYYSRRGGLRYAVSAGDDEDLRVALIGAQDTIDTNSLTDAVRRAVAAGYQLDREEQLRALQRKAALLRGDVAPEKADEGLPRPIAPNPGPVAPETFAVVLESGSGDGKAYGVYAPDGTKLGRVKSYEGYIDKKSPGSGRIVSSRKDATLWSWAPEPGVLPGTQRERFGFRSRADAIRDALSATDHRGAAYVDQKTPPGPVAVDPEPAPVPPPPLEVSDPVDTPPPVRPALTEDWLHPDVAAIQDLSPKQIDVNTEQTWVEQYEVATEVARLQDQIRRATPGGTEKAGEKPKWREDDRLYAMPFADVLAAYEPKQEYNYTTQEYGTVDLRTRYDALQERRRVAVAAEEVYRGEFHRRGRWTRAFLVTSSGGGHVHKSRECSTCRPGQYRPDGTWSGGTEFIWLPEYADEKEDRIVGDAGERACTTCYPTAPVSALNRKTRIFSPDERKAAEDRELRAQAKLEREAQAKANAPTATGEPLVINDGGIRETFRTERAALNWWSGAADYIGWSYKPDSQKRASWEAMEIVVAAIAEKRGVDPDEVRAGMVASHRKKTKKNRVDDPFAGWINDDGSYTATPFDPKEGLSLGELDALSPGTIVERPGRQFYTKLEDGRWRPSAGGSAGSVSAESIDEGYHVRGGGRERRDAPSGPAPSGPAPSVDESDRWEGSSWAPRHYASSPASEIRVGDHVLPYDADEVHEVLEVVPTAEEILAKTRSLDTRQVHSHNWMRTSLIRKLVASGAAALALSGVGISMLDGDDADADSPDAIAPPLPQTSISAQETPHVSVPAKARVAAPTSAAGFAAMWSKVPTAEWGAADVSLSIDLPGDRSVWLYGDTFSGNNGMVHSSAITQDGGTLHVSDGGRQLLPNDDANHIYWIEAAEVVDANHILVTAAPMEVGAEGPWDFKRTSEKSRTAMVTVDVDGDLHFARWVGHVDAPPKFADFEAVGEHHFTYESRAHPEVKLSSGKTLYTTNQNWDDDVSNHQNPDGSLRFEDYRPIFSEGEAGGRSGPADAISPEQMGLTADPVTGFLPVLSPEAVERAHARVARAREKLPDDPSEIGLTTGDRDPEQDAMVGRYEREATAHLAEAKAWEDWVDAVRAEYERRAAEPGGFVNDWDHPSSEDVPPPKSTVRVLGKRTTDGFQYVMRVGSYETFGVPGKSNLRDETLENWDPVKRARRLRKNAADSTEKAANARALADGSWTPETDAGYVKKKNLAEFYERRRNALAVWYEAIQHAGMKDPEDITLVEPPASVLDPANEFDPAFLSRVRNYASPYYWSHTNTDDYYLSVSMSRQAEEAADFRYRARDALEGNRLMLKKRLERGQNSIQQVDYMPDGGPGETTVAQLEAVVAMGQALEDEVDAQLAAEGLDAAKIFPDATEVKKYRQLLADFDDAKWQAFDEAAADVLKSRGVTNRRDYIMAWLDRTDHVYHENYIDSDWERDYDAAVGPELAAWAERLEQTLKSRTGNPLGNERRLYFERRKAIYVELLQRLGVPFGAPEEIDAPYVWDTDRSWVSPSQLKVGTLVSSGGDRNRPTKFKRAVTVTVVRQESDGSWHFEYSDGTSADRLPSYAWHEAPVTLESTDRVQARGIKEGLRQMPTAMVETAWGDGHKVTVRAARRGSRGTAELSLPSDHEAVSTVIHEEHHAVENNAAWVKRLEWAAMTDSCYRGKPGERKVKKGTAKELFKYRKTKLATILPGDGYSKYEIAFRDEFYSPYVGKVYAPGSWADDKIGSHTASYELLTMTSEAVLGDRSDVSPVSEQATRDRAKWMRAWYLGIVLLAQEHSAVRRGLKPGTPGAKLKAV